MGNIQIFVAKQLQIDKKRSYQGCKIHSHSYLHQNDCIIQNSHQNDCITSKFTSKWLHYIKMTALYKIYLECWSQGVQNYLAEAIISSFWKTFFNILLFIFFSLTFRQSVTKTFGKGSEIHKMQSSLFTAMLNFKYREL